MQPCSHAVGTVDRRSGCQQIPKVLSGCGAAAPPPPMQQHRSRPRSAQQQRATGAPVASDICEGARVCCVLCEHKEMVQGGSTMLETTVRI
jgi:hypothetical protein